MGNSKKQAVKILKSAEKKFLGKDERLLDIKTNERSLTHKFAEHLQGIVGTEWKVDCEYNRYRNDSKKITFTISHKDKDSAFIGSSDLSRYLNAWGMFCYKK